MKKSEAAAIGFETAAQIGPAVDFVDRLVVNKLFEDERGGLPTDAFEAQKAPVEPGFEEVAEVGIECRVMRCVGGMAEQIPAKGDESFGAMGSSVDAAEKLLARWLDGFEKRFLHFGAGLTLVFGSGVADDGFVGRKFALK